jgi:hypothetical protein
MPFKKACALALVCALLATVMLWTPFVSAVAADPLPENPGHEESNTASKSTITFFFIEAYPFIYWIHEDDGDADVVEYNGGPEYQNVNIPSVIRKYPVTGILYNAFSAADTSHVKSVHIPDTVTSIGNEAFWGCSALTDIPIPASISNIGDEVFRECYSMENFQVEAGSKYYTAKDGVLYNKQMTILVAYPAAKKASAFSIPSTVKKIVPYAFDGYQGTSITIPAGVTEIGHGAFHASGITSIAIPEGVTSIEPWTFEKCNLQKITIPSSVEFISDSAFGHAPSKEMTIYGYTGSYAQTYAKEHGVPFKSLGQIPVAISKITSNTKSGRVGSSITWSVQTKGGSGTKTYRFLVYKDGKRIVSGKFGSSKTYKYTPKEPGKYTVRVYVKDSTGTAEKTSAEVSVKAKPLAISGIKASKTSVNVGAAVTWTATAKDGYGKKTYRFVLYKNGKEISKGAYGSAGTFRYTPAAPGKYKVKVYVKDSTGTVSKTSAEVSAKAKALTISSIKANNTSVEAGAKITWTATAKYGYGKKTYRFVLYKDGKEISKGAYGSAGTFLYTPTAPGKYKVKVYVKDSSGTVSKISSNVSVR